MNENITQELERLVEQCVRPVKTHFADKKRMREDLLSHLSATFEEELERTGHEQEALHQTQLRFGNAEAVTRELRHNLSWQDKYTYFIERMLARQPGESFLRFASRHYLCALVLAISTSTFILLLKGVSPHSDPVTIFWVFTVILTVMSVTASTKQWLVDQMGRARLSGSKRLQLKYGISSIFIYPAAMFGIHLGLMIGPNLETYQISPSALLAALATACFGPVIVYILGPIIADRILYQEKWASIDLSTN